MSARRLFVVLLTSMATGCSFINAPRYIAQDIVHAKGATFAVEPFNMMHADSGYQGNTDFGQVLAEDFAGALQEKRYPSIAVSANSADVAAGYLIKGTVIEFDPGNFAARFWIFGTGSGLAHIKAQARIIRLSDGKELSVAEDSVYSSAWVNDEIILHRVCATLARKLSRQLIDNASPFK